MSRYQIIETNTDHQGNVKSFLVYFEDTNEVSTIGGTRSNVLLYDEGLYDILYDNEAIQLSHDPTLIVSATANEYSYIMKYKDDVIHTTPSQSDKMLEGIYEALSGNGVEKLKSLYKDVRSGQVRQDIINELVHMFGNERFRISIQSNGWLIDGLFLIDWNASLYTKNDDPNKKDLIRSGNQIVEADQSYEFVTLQQNHKPENTKVTINGEEFIISEREVLFLSKVQWVLNREKYHPDKTFWEYVSRFTDRKTTDGTQEPML